MAKIITSIILSVVAILPVYAQEHADTLKAHELKEVVVEATMQRTGVQKSTYIPTPKQKNASQSGADLLNHMAIPQLKTSLGNDTNEQFINGRSRAFIQLSATYTFGFGKKVSRDNEPGTSTSASSGILK